MSPPTTPDSIAQGSLASPGLLAGVSAWRQALGAHLTFEGALAPQPPRWVGRTSSGQPLFVELADGAFGGITLRLPTGHPELFAMARSFAPSDAGRITTGDAGFDEDVLVLGPSALAGLLDEHVRWIMRWLVTRGVVVSAGSVRLPSPASATIEVQSALSFLAALAEALTRPRDLPRDIVRIAWDDPNEAVRAHFRRLATTPEMKALVGADPIHAAVSDDDAAFELLVGNLGDREQDLETRASAATRLLERFPLERLVTIEAAAWQGLLESESPIGIIPAWEVPLIAAIRRQRSAPGAARNGLRIAEHLVAGDPLCLPEAVADCLLEKLDDNLGPADRAWLSRLTRHDDEHIAERASRELLETFGLAELARLADPTRTKAPNSQRSFDLLIDRLCLELEGPEVPVDTRATCLGILRGVMTYHETTTARPFLKSTSSDRAQRLLLALERGTEPALLPLLTALADHDDEPVRVATMCRLLLLPVPMEMVLSRLPPVRAIELLTAGPRLVREHPRLLYDRGGMVLAALYPNLVMLHPDARAERRLAYVEMLSRVGRATETEVVASALEHGFRPLRIAAANALVRMGGPAALPGLQAVTREGDGELKAIAREAIAAIRARHGDRATGLALADDLATGGLSLPSDRSDDSG